MIHPSSVATTAVLAAALWGMIGISAAQEVLPRPEPPFKGHSGWHEADLRESRTDVAE
jgi:hypothetical protein